jgi:hypothetical protein
MGEFRAAVADDQRAGRLAQDDRIRPASALLWRAGFVRD